MKHIFLITVISTSFFVFDLSANPTPQPAIISELKVTTPTNWQLELIGEIPVREFKVILKSNRYNDTFLITNPIDDYLKATFPVISSDSVLPATSVKKLDLQDGDSLVVILKPKGNLVLTEYSECIVVSSTGPDSSQCRCPKFVDFKAASTMGLENFVPSNQKTIRILSSKDSLPVAGLGLYENRRVTQCPEFTLPVTDEGLATFLVSVCDKFRWIDIKNSECGPLFKLARFDYVLGALPDTQTFYIDLTTVKTLNIPEKSNGNISVISTSAQILFVIKGIKGISELKNLHINTLSGKKVKEIPVNITQSGTYTVGWDRTDSKGKHLSGGIYLAKLEMNGCPVSKRFVLK
jgi:hypothetical protein